MNRREGKEPVKENAWVEKNRVENEVVEVVNVENEKEENLIENAGKNIVENAEKKT